jgi:Protein of unknown function (DUF3592)
MKDFWTFYLFLAAFPGLIAFAALYKYMQVKQASYWPSVPGRIVVSTSQAREVSRGDANTDDTERRTFARIEYDYTVAGRKYRGTRVGIGEDMGNFEVAETIARYPVGKPVTVYYNPGKRDQAVLERDAPAGLWKGVAILVLAMSGIIVAAVVGFGKLPGLFVNVVSDPKRAPFVAALVGFAAVASLVIYAFQKTAAQARAWPTVTGRIQSSDVHPFEARDTSDSRVDRWRTLYRAEVVYSYEVAGVRYTGDRLGSGEISASTDALARRAAARYPEGSAVDVHYNPDNPADALLHPGRPWWLLLLWLAPLAVLAMAYIAAR